MRREDYQRYLDAFNARDYDSVYDFYAEGSELAFFGATLKSRQDFKDFYSFLHSYVSETITIERYAGSDELVALEAVVRIEARRDLDRATLDARGLHGFFPIRTGEVQTMRQYVHYHVREGKFTGVGCALA
jgi:hypothetical protein